MPSTPSLTRRSLFAFALLCLVVSPAAPGSETPPEAVVERAATALLEALAGRREAIEADAAVGHRLVEEVIEPYVDFEATARLVLGAHWRTATAKQLERFTAELGELLTRSVSSTLSGFGDASIEVLPSQTEPSARTADVRSRVTGAGGAGTDLDFRLRRGIDGWKVINITVDGVSLVASYRQSFNALIRREGLEALIEQLALKNEAARADSRSARQG